MVVEVQDMVLVSYQGVEPQEQCVDLAGAERLPQDLGSPTGPRPLCVVP